MELQQNQTPVTLKFLLSTKNKSPCNTIFLATALESVCTLNGSTEICVESGRGCPFTSGLTGPCGNVGTPGPPLLESCGFSDFVDESQILFYEA